MNPDAIDAIVARIAELVDSRRIDEADAPPSDPRLHGKPPRNVEVIRLEQRLTRMKRREVDDALRRAVADLIDVAPDL